MSGLTQVHANAKRDETSARGSLYGNKFEAAYFRRYDSDHLKQLHDGFQEKAIIRYALPERRAELLRVLEQAKHLSCANDPNMRSPGRSAFSLQQLTDNVQQYLTPKVRSLRWNEHYWDAVKSVAEEVIKLLPIGETLKPMILGDVAESAAVQKNLDKNAGYFAFETGRRSKGENLQDAVEWCIEHKELILEQGFYGLPLVVSHRSSNSKPISDTEWKWRCRIILMQDVRALLLDGRFAIPLTTLFADIPWGEGSMNDNEVASWVMIKRCHYDRFYSSDYSKFDVSQPAWLLEDVFYHVLRPCFGELSDEDERLYEAMVNSYIHKEIHSFDGIYYAHDCQISGSLMTYMINTIVNEIMDRTALIMQGCNYHNFESLKCGDDNLTYYSSREPWDPQTHCRLIKKYFGVETKLEAGDYGSSDQDPVFLSRTWTYHGQERPILEVLWNLIFPERFRPYKQMGFGSTMERAVALVLLCSCYEQDSTARKYFDVHKIEQVAQIRSTRDSQESTYSALAKLGPGFADSWLRWHLGEVERRAS